MDSVGRRRLRCRIPVALPVVAAAIGCGGGGSSSGPDPGTTGTLEIRLLEVGTGVDPNGLSVETARRILPLTVDEPIRIEGVSPGTYTTTVRGLEPLCFPLGGDPRGGERTPWLFPEVFAGQTTRFEIELLCFGDFAYLTNEGITYVSRSGGEAVLPASRLSEIHGWSPDGTALLYTAADEGNEHVYVFRPDQSSSIRLTQGSNDHGMAAWSPDGARIAYREQLPSGQGAVLHVMDADGGNSRQLTTPPPFIGDEGPRWSPDGARLVFFRNVDIHVVDLDGSNLRAIAPHAADDRNAAWSPDGEWLYFWSDRAGGDSWDPWLVRPDGSGLRQFPNPSPVCAWHPEGGRLACQAGGSSFDSPTRILDLDGNVLAEARVQRPTWTTGDRWLFGAASITGLGFTAYRERDGVEIFFRTDVPVRQVFVNPGTPAR